MDSALVSARTTLLATVSRDPETIEEVIEQLARIREAAESLRPRGDQDGIASFTKLYHRITCAIRDAYGKDRFHAGDFILDLDVGFARRYIQALRADLTSGRTAPRCWTILFDRRREEGIGIWRFAVAGVNAHVNFDLAFALPDVWLRDGRPEGETLEKQHADYTEINRIFYDEMNALQDLFDGPGEDWPDSDVRDRGLIGIADVIVWVTREAAWRDANRLWGDREETGYREAGTARLDGIAAWLAEIVV